MQTLARSTLDPPAPARIRMHRAHAILSEIRARGLRPRDRKVDALAGAFVIRVRARGRQEGIPLGLSNSFARVLSRMQGRATAGAHTDPRAAAIGSCAQICAGRRGIPSTSCAWIRAILLPRQRPMSGKTHGQTQNFAFLLGVG